jgi:hypothetical protein
MHFCGNPFDVLDYYDLVNADGSFNDFAEVEALDDAKTNDNKKYCTTKLKVGAKLSFAGFIKACVNFTIDKTKIKGENVENDNGIKVYSRNGVLCVESTVEATLKIYRIDGSVAGEIEVGIGENVYPLAPRGMIIINGKRLYLKPI